MGVGVGGVGEVGKSSSRWVVVGVGEGEFQSPGGGKSSSRRVGGVGGRRDRRRGKRSSGGGGRGNDGRWTATATARLRLAANGLASLDFSSILGSVFCDFLRSVNRFHFLVIYRILGFICWKFKKSSFGCFMENFQFDYCVIFSFMVHGSKFCHDLRVKFLAPNGYIEGRMGFWAVWLMSSDQPYTCNFG